MGDKKYIVDGQSTCEVVTTFINALIKKGFTVINNGDYDQEKDIMPNPNGLFFRLKSPIDLREVDLTNETYYLASVGKDLYMCECHYHLVKLMSPD